MCCVWCRGWFLVCGFCGILGGGVVMMFCCWGVISVVVHMFVCLCCLCCLFGVVVCLVCTGGVCGVFGVFGCLVVCLLVF